MLSTKLNFMIKSSPRKFDPTSKEPFKISRSKVELFMNCPRCFYLDRRLAISRPPGFPFNLNSAVDTLLKKEFDQYRGQGIPHPLMEKYGINACPLSHHQIEEWRDSLHRGIQYLHTKTNFLITGGVDDVWANDDGEFIVVDYKATSKNGAVSIDEDWQISYKRQMSLYAWLFKMNAFPVSDTGYFVYCNGITDRESFSQRLEFDVTVIPYKIDDSWVEGTLNSIRQCLHSDAIPDFQEKCEFCTYVKAAGNPQAQSPIA